MKFPVGSFLLFLILLSRIGSAQSLPPAAAVAIAADSSQVRSARAIAASAEDSVDNNDFNPGLGLFALFAITAMLLCVGAGIAVGAVVLAIIAGLLAVGLLSGSVLVGWYQKSALAGFKFLLFSGLSLASGATGALFVWFVNRGLHWFSPASSFVIGATGGLLAGVLIAFLLLYVLRRFVKYLGAGNAAVR